MILGEPRLSVGICAGIFHSDCGYIGWTPFNEANRHSDQAYKARQQPSQSERRRRTIPLDHSSRWKNLALDVPARRQGQTHDLGKYPDVPLSLARDRHGEARKLLATGIDPMAQRKAEKAAVENSFQNIASLWLEHWRDGKSPRHVD